MDKKVITLSFRTSETNNKYLRKLAESDERSLSYVLNKMVDIYRIKGIKHPSEIK